MANRLSVALFILTILAAGCGSPSTSQTIAAPPAPLLASPSSLQFLGTAPVPLPQLVTITKASALVGPLVATVADPKVAGASTPVQTGPTTASFSIYSISAGSTLVSVTDAAGSVATIPISGWLCGRPPNLVSAQLVYPKPGSTQVPTTIGKLYFGIVSVSTPQPSQRTLPLLHLFFGTPGAYQTLEGSFLQMDTPPSPSPTVAPVLPTPYPFSTVSYMSAGVPVLVPNTTYTAQLYDDTCQGPSVAGSFST